MQKNGAGSCEAGPFKANSDNAQALHSANASQSQPVVLRPYQHDAVERIRNSYRAGSRRVLLTAPTGSGKTVVFSYVVSGALARGSQVLVVVHRVELVDQVAMALGRLGVQFGVIASGVAESDAPVQIAMVASIGRRLDRWRDRFDFVVIDECHHSVAGSWAAVLASQPRAKVLGVTATPERLDGRGLGELFDELVMSPSTAELIEAGWLSPFVVFEPAATPDLSGARIRAGDYAVEDIREAMDGVVVGAAVTEYKRLCPGIPAVVFCVDVAHSEDVAAAFNAAGVQAAHVDGQTPADDRRATIAALGTRSLDVITNCGLISEGVDVPAIGAAILLRPTASLALYLQMVGRALRLAPGKQRAVLLDFAGNTSRHGLPDAPRPWSLESKARRQRDKGDGPQLRKCAACNAMNRPGAKECCECGADLRTVKERREIEVKLEEAKQREEEEMIVGMRPRERWSWAGADERRLRTVARVSGYKPGWVHYRLQELRQATRGIR